MFGLFIDNYVLRQVGNQLKNPAWIIDYVLILQVFISVRFPPFIFFPLLQRKISSMARIMLASQYPLIYGDSFIVNNLGERNSNVAQQ